MSTEPEPAPAARLSRAERRVLNRAQHWHITPDPDRLREALAHARAGGDPHPLTLASTEPVSQLDALDRVAALARARHDARPRPAA